MTVRSYEVSMANGNGSSGDSTLLIVTPQTAQEAKVGFVPHTQTQPVQCFLVTEESS